MAKNLPAMRETQVESLGGEDHPVKGMATYSNTLDWRIPWTEEPSGLQSMCMWCLVAQSYLTLYDFSVHGDSPGKNSMESKNQMGLSD